MVIIVYILKKAQMLLREPWLLASIFFGYKLPEYSNKGHNYKYKLPSLREDGGNLIVSGYVKKNERKRICSKWFSRIWFNNNNKDERTHSGIN